MNNLLVYATGEQLAGPQGASAHRRSRSNVARVRDTFRTWHQRATGRAQLRRMDARLLQDIGITDHEAAIEAGKPFWQA